VSPGHCNHLTVDETVEIREHLVTSHRRCLLCGASYDRGQLLAKLERLIRDRWHLGVSPWTSEELSEEADL
jgi:hypothetical protein